jgi:protein XagA
MRGYLRIGVMAGAIAAVLSGAAEGGAFLMSAGRGQAILTTEFSKANKAFDAHGKIVATPPYRKMEERAYVEYGATDWLTLVGSASGLSFHGAGDPFVPLSVLIAEAKSDLPLTVVSTPGAHYLGAGLGALGARAPLWESSALTLSVEASLRAATPRARNFLDMKTGAQPEARLQLGVPTEFFGLLAFGDAQIGYRPRGASGDEMLADFTYGLRPRDDFLLLFQSFATLAPRLGGYRSQKFEVSAVYDVTRSVSVQLGALRALEGLNSSADKGFIGALWVRF